MSDIAIIGAGAAGCFCAIGIRRRKPECRVTVYEAGPKALAKVAVTGGGRCNLTNSFRDIGRLEEAYPRGAQLMKRALRRFSNEDAMAWFAREGVPCVIQEDQCVFPKSQDAMQIVRTLERQMRVSGVSLKPNSRVSSIRSGGGAYRLAFTDGSEATADKVVVTTGGGALKLLEGLDSLEIVRPVPSLFTFRIDDSGLRSLMGTVVDNAILGIAGTAFKSRGTLLLTDWGVSGPATLRLSSYAARHLAGTQYKGTLIINWTGRSENEVREWIAESTKVSPRKRVSNVSPEGISTRLWQHIATRAGLQGRIWAELGSKGINRLAATLTADSYSITGRCHFKEEFVTAGGVALSNVNPGTLESKAYPGLYFAGEVLDVDAVTGGFNLQAAWSTGFVVAENI